MSDDTDRVDCPLCAGAGVVRHPAWGTRTCPTPEIDCPACKGKGWL